MHLKHAVYMWSKSKRNLSKNIKRTTSNKILSTTLLFTIFFWHNRLRDNCVTNDIQNFSGDFIWIKPFDKSALRKQLTPVIVACVSCIAPFSALHLTLRFFLFQFFQSIWKWPSLNYFCYGQLIQLLME